MVFLMPVEAVFGGAALGFALYWHGRLLPRTIDGPPSLRSTLSAHPPSAAFTTGLISTGIVLSHFLPTAFYPLPFVRIPMGRLVIAAILVSAGATFANACTIPHLCPYGRPFRIRLVALAALAAVVTATLLASSRFFNPSPAVSLPPSPSTSLQLQHQLLRQQHFGGGGSDTSRLEVLHTSDDQSRDALPQVVQQEHLSKDHLRAQSMSILPSSSPCQYRRHPCNYNHRFGHRHRHHPHFYYHFSYRNHPHHHHHSHRRRPLLEPVYILLVATLLLSASVPPLLARTRAPPPPPLLQEMLGYTLGLSTGLALVSADALHPARVLSALDLEAEKWNPSFLLTLAAAAVVVTSLRPGDHPAMLYGDVHNSVLKLPDPLDVLHPPCNGCMRGVLGTILFGAGCGMAGIAPSSALIYFGAFPTHLHCVAVVVSMLATTALCSLAIAAFDDPPPEAIV